MIEYSPKFEDTVLTKKGKIQHITDKKDTYWLTYIVDKKIVIPLHISKPAPISSVELKSNHTDKLTIEFLKKQEVIKTIDFTFDYDKKQNSTMPVNIKQNVDKINLILQSENHKQVGLSYVIFKGEKIIEKQKTVKNVSKEDELNKTIYEPKKTKAEKNVDLFSHRQKRGKLQIQKQIQQLGRGYQKNFVGHANTRKSNRKQQQDLQKAIKLSQQAYKTQNKQKMQLENEEVAQLQKYQFQAEQPTGETQFKPFIINEKAIKALANVSSQWLMAQKKMQENYFISKNKRLSQKISVKHLHNDKFYIDGLFGLQKNKIISIIESLGGNVLKQPEQYCYFIVGKVGSDEVNKAKLKKGIKFVKKQFVLYCKNYDTKADYKKFEIN